MRLKYSLKTAVKGLRTNRSRSLLTILGIVIGITAIMMVMSLGKGAQDLILNQIQSIGSKTIAVVPGRHPTGISDSLSTFTDSIKNKDVEDLKKKSNVPHLTRIMPIVFGPVTATKGNKVHATTVFGVNNFFAEIYNIYPEDGRLFMDEEVSSKSAVVIIGSKVKDELFEPGETILGQKIRVKNQTLRIIGVLPNKGQFSFISFDDALIRVPVISSLTETKEGRTAFSIGTLAAVTLAVVFAYLLSHLIDALSFAHLISASFIYLLAFLLYFDLLTPKVLIRKEEKIMAVVKKPKRKFISLVGVGFIVSFATLIDDIIVLIPLYLENASFTKVTLGIYLAAILQIIVAIFFAGKISRLSFKKEISVISLVILAFLVLLRVI